MDSENSMDGELEVKGHKDEEANLSDDEREAEGHHSHTGGRSPSNSSVDALRHSRSRSPPWGSNSGSPVRRTPSGSPAQRTPSGSPARHTPSGSPRRRTPSGSPTGSPRMRTPSGSPTGSPRMHTPSGSPTGSPRRRTPSGSPTRRTPSGSPAGSPSRRTSSGSPGMCTPSHSPSRRSASGSPVRLSPSIGDRRRSPSSSPVRRRSSSPHGSPRISLSNSSARRSPSASTGRSPTGSLSRSPSGSRHSEHGSYSRRSRVKKSKRRSDDGQLSDGSDDGRSNISSSSSSFEDGQKGRSRAENGDQEARSKKFEPHNAEDLSDVSDLDSAAGDGSLDSLSDEDDEQKKSRTKSLLEEIKKEDSEPTSPIRAPPISSRKDIVSQSDEMEQLDFEAEEPQGKEDREEGECGEAARRPASSINDTKSEGDDGELKGDEIEEGEITDEDENRPEETEPRPICRFYNRGQCTWGSSCRFLHPGVTDKGNYTMFDMVRPLVPANGPPMYGPMMDFRAPMERPIAPMGPVYSSRKEEAPMVESAWERGLRTAKEMMRKASKRKETDMDFDEKKMNLSLGQDELDKENDYYTRPASPALDDERWSDKEGPEGKHHRVVVADRYDSMDPYYAHHREGADRWSRGHYEADMRLEYGREHIGYDRRSHHPHPHMAYRAHMHPSTHHDPAYYPDKYERKKKSHTVREVIVQHSRKPWKEERPSTDARRGRGDEWADPWMRSKSPSSRKARPSRRQSYSSGSSYSSSSSSRSSRSYSSSYSRSPSRSRSRSRSKSRSASISRSRSHTPPTQPLRRPGRSGYRAGGSPPQSRQRRPAADARARGTRAVSPALLSEKRAATERAMHMNPPAPSPRKQRPPSPAMMRKTAQNPPAPGQGAARGLDRKAVGGKVRRSKSSRSSSSDSSGSSSDSSETSLSSSSSSRDNTPPPKQKKIVMDERLLAQTNKGKAMDALKLSGQKQQIKLTLKAPGSTAPSSADDPRRSALIAGKKRPAESPPPETAKVATATKPVAKKTTSRREELLKQLKAVEDAIARKRSKIS